MLTKVVLSLLKTGQIGVTFEQDPAPSTQPDVYLFVVVTATHMSRFREQAQLYSPALTRLKQADEPDGMAALDRTTGSRVVIGASGKPNLTITAGATIRQDANGFGMMGGPKQASASPSMIDAFGWFLADRYRDDQITLMELSRVASKLHWYTRVEGIPAMALSETVERVMESGF